MTVSHILNSKGREVVTARSQDSVRSVAQLLTSKRIGAVVVLKSSGEIEGIISERDIVHCVAKQGCA
jgi:CBS domain-containing protein